MDDTHTTPDGRIPTHTRGCTCMRCTAPTIPITNGAPNNVTSQHLEYCRTHLLA